MDKEFIMQCPNCGHAIKAAKIMEKQTKFGMVEKFRCPDCNTWLSLKRGPLAIRSIGLVLVFLGSVLGMVQSAPDNIVIAGVAFSGAVLALVATIVNKPSLMK